MKFRVQCASCGTTFFSPDRKARICPKCAKKHQAAPAGKPPASRPPRPDSRPPAPKLPSLKPKTEQRKPKAAEITPEQKQRLQQIYQEKFQGAEAPEWKEMVKIISDELWVNRKTVTGELRNLVYPKVDISPEIKAEIIRRYKHYVDHNERPPEGRRKKISADLAVPYQQIRNILYEWSQGQFSQSPTPELSRELRFEIEKAYFAELDAQREKLDDIPSVVAERLGTVTRYQVSRWLDTLHDDDSRFNGVASVAPEIEAQVIEEYRRYLASSVVPEKGLHKTISEKIGGLNARQVHKILQSFRKSRRQAYPLH
jgi:hypothetical protein